MALIGNEHLGGGADSNRSESTEGSFGSSLPVATSVVSLSSFGDFRARSRVRQGEAAVFLSFLYLHGPLSAKGIGALLAEDGNSSVWVLLGVMLWLRVFDGRIRLGRTGSEGAVLIGILQWVPMSS
jgi:hypothetical protein